MKNGERFLLMRHGGIGDTLFATPVARKLREYGYQVDISVRENNVSLFDNSPHVKRIYAARRFGPMQRTPDGKMVNLIDIDGIVVPDLVLYSKYKTSSTRPWRPFNVCNFFLIIEGSTLHPEICPTQISSFSNVYDNHLAWAGIDPNKLTDEEKSPQMFVSKEEEDWARSVLPADRRTVMVQTASSSLVKTYPSSDVVKWLKEHGYSVLLWEETGERTGRWLLDAMEIAIPQKMSPLRATAALLTQSCFAVTADTGTAHMAEALGVMHLTYYTFVPAWTISKYYRYEVTVDASVMLDGRECKCYQLVRDCPRKNAEAFDKLTKSEKELLLTFPSTQAERQPLGLPLRKVAVPKGTDPLQYFKCNSKEALKNAVNIAYSRLEVLRMERPYCTDSIDLIKALEENHDRLQYGGRNVCKNFVPREDAQNEI